MTAKLPETPVGDADPSMVSDLVLPGEERRPFVPPRDALEDELTRIWKSLLEVAAVSVDDDFFELGGHSLSAVAMVTRVSDAFDRVVPLSLLLENPTLAGFADALVRTTREGVTGVTTLRADGIRPPLFFLHGDLNGGGLYCARLARGFTSQPFYTLDPLGSLGDDAPASIEEMASRHAAAIRRVRPHGPYLLGGHCNGALEALEIARQLRAAGEQVPALFMIEPPSVDTRLRPLDWTIRAAARMARFDDERRVDVYLRACGALQHVAQHPATGPRFVYQKLWRLTQRTNAMPSAEAVSQSSPPSVLRHNLPVWRRYTRAVAAYVPRRYDGSAAVLVGDEVVSMRVDPVDRWRRVGPRLEFHVVRGGHLSCVTAHVASTSAVIDRYLDAALRQR